MSEFGSHESQEMNAEQFERQNRIKENMNLLLESLVRQKNEAFMDMAKQEAGE